MNPCDQLLVQALNETNSNRLWIADENISPQLISQIHFQVQAQIHDQIPGQTLGQPLLQAITNRADIGSALLTRNIATEINDFDFSSLGSFEQIIYRVSKERILVQHCINQAFNHLPNGGKLILLGEKSDGIKTHGKFAEDLFSSKISIEKNGRCYLAQVIKNRETKHPRKQSRTQALGNYHELQIFEQDGLNFYSKPGLYGWKKIDVGSRLLIETIEPILSTINTKELSLLDLGCGYGYLTLMIARAEFKHLWATDNNVAAILAAEKNFALHNLPVTLNLDDCGKNIHRHFEIIVCNPPFHQGFAHDSSLLQKFVSQSLALLSPHGIAFFVVNEFVPLQQAAKQLHCDINLLAHMQGFKVFKLTRRR